MSKAGNIIKISGGVFNELAADDISYTAESINMVAAINVNEEGEQGISFF